MKGARIACFTLLESMVQETERPRLRFQMDAVMVKLSEASEDAVRFTACDHNLLRMWANT